MMEHWVRKIDRVGFSALKGEFEAEGLSRQDVAIEALFACRYGLDYLVKIGGCEAKSDVLYLEQLGITSLVAPMIESAFAMEKYMGMIDKKPFSHIGVTIETTTAVERIEEILAAGVLLSDVTIGRTDLTASYRGTSVDSPETIAMVKQVAKAGKARGLNVTMGGSVNTNTRTLLREDEELAGMIDYVETRKVIMPVDAFTGQETLEKAIDLELELLQLRTSPLGQTLSGANDRIAQIKKRIVAWN